MIGDLLGFSNVRLNELERKDLARRHLDAAEAWLRRLIDAELTAARGSDYLADGAAGTCPEISKKTRERINGRYSGNPSRFPRLIDATDLGDAIKIVLKHDLYRDVLHGLLLRLAPHNHGDHVLHPETTSRADRGREGFWPPLPPNRTGGFPAYGSPVVGSS